MPHIRVVTDSTCDLPDALLKQFDITVVPHMLQFGTETDLDKIGISTPQLMKHIEDGEPSPQVIAPSIDDFSRVYRSLRETCDGIISVHISAKLSETLSNVGVAREAFGPGGVLAQLEDQPSHPSPGEIRVGVHRPHPRGVAGRIKELGIPAGRVVAAVQGGPAAPAAAAGDVPLAFHDEVGSVRHQLAIEAHDRPAGACRTGGRRGHRT